MGQVLLNIFSLLQRFALTTLKIHKTSVSKMVRLINGFVVLDVFGLTLSRAVDLAIG